MIELRTGCRLHFGLAELSPGQPNRYAGLGVMLKSPNMHLRISWDAAVPDVTLPDGIDADSLMEYQHRIEAWQRTNNDTHVELIEGFPFHSGLGAGTQLACLLAVAKQLKSIATRNKNLDANLFREPNAASWLSVSEALEGLEAQSLAASSQRGLRSAIGLQGFLTGGLILDMGYEGSDSVRREVRAESVDLPANWRIVLIRGSTNSAITGPLETSMIGAMAAKPNPHRQQMLQLAKLALTSASKAEFGKFCQAMEEYMQYAGDMFAPIQGGRYNGAVCSQAVAVAHQFGLKAVGQSSWGPTIFGLASDAQSAQQIAQSIASHASNWQVQVAEISQTGAEVRFSI